MSSSARGQSVLGSVSSRLPHSTIIGWGSLFGHKPKRPAPVTLQGLPFDKVRPNSPFAHSIVAAGAGQTHACFVCDDGAFIMIGGNRYGQSGRPTSGVSKPAMGEGVAKSRLLTDDPTAECTPLFFDLGFPPSEAPDAVSCGSNFSLFYKRGGRTVVGVGNNHMGQLATGHKVTWGNDGGFAEWGEEPEWAVREPSTTVERESVFLCEPTDPTTNSVQEATVRKRIQKARTPGESWPDAWARHIPLTIPSPPDTAARNDLLQYGIKEIVCGTNHTLIWLNNDVVYCCGSNLAGELGLGNTLSPMNPLPIWSLDHHICRVDGVHRDDTAGQLAAVEAMPPVEEVIKHLGSWRDIWANRKLKQIACGNGFSMFLTTDGRVFGCGANRLDQIGRITYEVQAVSHTRPHPDTHLPVLVKVKHIAAMSEMSIFVTTNNEVLVRGGIEGMGVFTHDRLHPLLPLEGDVVSEARIASLLQRREKKGPLSESAKEELIQQYRQRHPPIVKVWASGNNAFLQYDDGRIVGFGANLDSQVQIIDGSGLLLRRRLGGAQEGSGISIKEGVNYAPGCVFDKVALMCPACEGVVGRTHLAMGVGFVMMAVEGDVALEEVLANKYRAERDLKRSVGIATDDVVMSDILLPPTVPEESNPPPADFALKMAPVAERAEGVTGGARGALPGRRGVLSKAIFRSVPTSAPPGAYDAPAPAAPPSPRPPTTAPKRKIVW